jgi:hypothetical protein
MNRLILVALAAALAPVVASAQLYKYVDKDGKTVYTDQPPPNAETKQIRVQSAPPAPSPAASKSAVEKDKELEKGRKEARDSAKKADDAGKNAQASEERCNAAKANYSYYLDGTRLFKRSNTGERVFLEDNEIAAEKEKARVAMEQACKKG